MGNDKEEGRERPLIRLHTIRLRPLQLPPLKLRLSPRRLFVTVFAIGLFVAGVSLCSNAVFHRRLSKAGYESKACGHRIQLAIERWAVDSGGCYPESLRAVGTSQFPPNPYSGLLRNSRGLEEPRPMRALQPGQYCPGDFLYLPVKSSYSHKEIHQYVLIVCAYFGQEYIGLRPPATPSDSGRYTYDEAALIAETYRKPGTWR